MPDADTEGGAEYRIANIHMLNQKILFLVYYGHFSYMDCEGMTSQELNWFYEGLLEIKKEEAEAMKGSK